MSGTCGVVDVTGLAVVGFRSLMLVASSELES